MWHYRNATSILLCITKNIKDPLRECLQVPFEREEESNALGLRHVCSGHRENMVAIRRALKGGVREALEVAQLIVECR